MAKQTDQAHRSVPLLQHDPRLNFFDAPRARPNIQCDDVAKAALIDRLSNGELLITVVGSDPELPSLRTIREARKADPVFDAAIETAREYGMALRRRGG